MMSYALLAFVLLLGISVASAACGFGSIDVSGLTTKSDYSGSASTYSYKMNVCGMSNEGKCDQSICQFNAAGEKVAGLGKYDGAQPTWSYIDPTTPAKGVKAAFTNGNTCWMGGEQTRYANVLFQCSDSESGTFTIVEDPQCTFTLTMATKKACPGGSGTVTVSVGISGGWVFIILLLVGTFVYVLGGCIYKRKKLGLSGNEACPNYDFWKEVPVYVKDGFRFVFVNKCKRGGTYNQL